MLSKYGDYCELSQNELRWLMHGEQYNGVVRDTLTGTDHPSTFWLVPIGPWEKEKLYWVDIVTWQLYCPVTGKCQSGDYLMLKGPMKPAKKKLRRSVKNNKSVLTIEVDDE